MEDGLAGARSDVENGAVSLLDVALAGDLSGGEVAAANDLGVGGLRFLESGKVPLRNDENVGRRFWIDIFKGEDMVVFVNFPGWNLATDDAAEETVGIVSHGLPSFHRMTGAVKRWG